MNPTKEVKVGGSTGRHYMEILVQAYPKHVTMSVTLCEYGHSHFVTFANDMVTPFDIDDEEAVKEQARIVVNGAIKKMLEALAIC